MPDSLLVHQLLPRDTPALGLQTPVLADGRPGPSDTLYLLGPLGGVAAMPAGAATAAVSSGRHVDFGRSPDVAVRLGPADPSVSRRQGTLRHDGHDWWLANSGSLPIRVSEVAEPLLTDQEIRVRSGFTPLFVDSERRTHVLELLVSGLGPADDEDLARLATRPRPTWALSPSERLVATAVFAAYLRREEEPRPTVTAEVADQLSELTGHVWTARRVARVVDGLRVALAGLGVPQMLQDQAPPEALRHHLYRALAVDTATLTARDLDLLDPDGSADDAARD